jgi:hypothetical protein
MTLQGALLRRSPAEVWWVEPSDGPVDNEHNFENFP